MTDQSDDRSPLAMATAWASTVTSIALEMALPALVGHWIDRWLDTGPWFLSLGALFGLVAGMWHLLRLAAKTNARPRDSDAADDRPVSPPADAESENP